MSKVCFVIENLGSGGAQKQLFLTAQELLKEGVSIEVLCYQKYGKDFYTSQLEDLGVKVTFLESPKYLQRILGYRRYIREERPTTVISMLYGANILSCLTSFFYRKNHQLIVSDRTGIFSDPSLKDRFRYQLYKRADHVVCNSTHTAKILRKRAPWLKRKIKVIWNMVHPIEGKSKKSEGKSFVFLMGARYHPDKNQYRLIQSFQRNLNKVSIGETEFILKFFGNRSGSSHEEYYKQLEALVASSDFPNNIRLEGETENMEDEIVMCDYCVLPSFYEGCPNFAIEAMSAQKPVILSDVCSNADILPRDGGILVDPHSDTPIWKRHC